MNSLINSSSEYHVNPHGAWENYFYVSSILFFNQGQFLFYILYFIFYVAEALITLYHLQCLQRPTEHMVGWELS